jgi:hypothetical protein
VNTGYRRHNRTVTGDSFQVELAINNRGAEADFSLCSAASACVTYSFQPLTPPMSACRRLLLAQLLLIPALALAEPPKAATLDPNFLRALGALLAELGNVKTVHDLCVERFPESTASLDADYAEWHAHHLSLITEVDSKVQLSDRETKQYARFGAGMTAERISALTAKGQTMFRERLVSEGADSLKRRCDGFQAWERSPSTDPEAVHPEQVSKIREYPSQ